MGKGEDSLPHEIKESLTMLASSGQIQDIQQLSVDCIPQKKHQKLVKLLKASKHWQVHDGIVRDEAGISFNGIAAWGRFVTIRMSGNYYRVRLFYLDRMEKRITYAIPVHKSEKLSDLPGINLSKTELKLIQKMAKALLYGKSCEEVFLTVSHPAKSTLQRQRDAWPVQDLDLFALRDMLQEPAFRQIVIAALDSQLRVYEEAKDAPQGIYNFVLPKQGDDEWFRSVIGALTFSNESAAINSGVIEVPVRKRNDLEKWRLSKERLVVLRTATGALLQPLIEEILENERILKCGGKILSFFPTVPIAVTRSAQCCEQVVDVDLPKGRSPLEYSEQDLLRTAMKCLLHEKVAEDAYGLWKKRRSDVHSYRINGFDCWREILLEKALDIWFSGDKETVQAFCKEHRQQQEAVAKKRKEMINKGYELLTCTEEYRGQIVQRPRSREEWEKEVDGGAVAFYFKPSKGSDCGKSLLAFTKKSLLKLLYRVGFDDNLLDGLLKKCTRSEALCEESCKIRLGGDTITAITFYREKF